MLHLDDKKTRILIEMSDKLKSLLKATSTSPNTTWFELYNHWKEENQYTFIIYLQDISKHIPAKDILFNDPSDTANVMFFNVLSMSIFICKSFIEYSRQTVSNIIEELHPEKKLEIIRNYFLFINNGWRFHSAITLLQNTAKESGVLYGPTPVDLSPTYYFFEETLAQYSVESIYLLYTYWRITSDESYLIRMISSITKYIRTYYRDLAKDENMHLDWPIEKENTIQQLNILSNWFEVLCFHVDNSLNEYRRRRWFISVDQLIDEPSFPPFISYFEMLKYKDFYPGYDNGMVVQKGVYFHSYGVWIKTVDVINITSQVVRIIYDKSIVYETSLGISRVALLELSDNLNRIMEYFSGLLFTHKEFYNSMRKKYSFSILDANEHNAQRIDSSIDKLILFTEGIINKDIEQLLQSKRMLFLQFSDLVTDGKEILLDKYMDTIIERLKAEIKKTKDYSDLYKKISLSFDKYVNSLLAYPDIFCSLVSAEYLYGQYIDQQQSNNKFDYSCISILYYTALEDFINKLLYTPYAVNILDPNASVVRRNYRLYISSSKIYWDSKNNCYKHTCEIGNLGFLFEAVRQETKFAEYLQRQYPKIDLQHLTSFGTKLKNVSVRRNAAAHGGNRITYDDVLIDKKQVYTLDNPTYGLIMEFFRIIFSY